MKRRSAQRASRQPPEELTYFTDRCLAKKFPRLLREAGVSVVSYAEAFDDPALPDHEWIRRACDRGWVCLTHDKATYKDDTLDEVFVDRTPSGALFILRGSVPTQTLAGYFLEARVQAERLVRRQRKSGEPFLGVIRRRDVRGGREKVVAVLDADRKKWQARQRKRR